MYEVGQRVRIVDISNDYPNIMRVDIGKVFVIKGYDVCGDYLLDGFISPVPHELLELEEEE